MMILNIAYTGYSQRGSLRSKSTIHTDKNTVVMVDAVIAEGMLEP